MGKIDLHVFTIIVHVGGENATVGHFTKLLATLQEGGYCD